MLTSHNYAYYATCVANLLTSGTFNHAGTSIISKPSLHSQVSKPAISLGGGN
jgi:hypothetical protein